MDDESFLSQIIFPDLKKQYARRIKEALREVNRTFGDESVGLQSTHESHIETDREHDEAIDICVYPFVDRYSSISSLGYRFIRAAPLLELETQNVDFLIYKREGTKPIAIFGEAKSSITNYSRVLTELAERRKAIESKLDYVKSECLKTDSDPICEYVLAVKGSIAINARDAILDSGQQVILWIVDYLDRRLSMGQAPNEQPQRRMMTHSDPILTKTLGEGVSSSAATFAYYPQSHTATRLKSVLRCFEETEHGLIIPLLRLRQFIDTQLFYLSEEEKTNHMDGIIRELQKIGFAVRSEVKPELHVLSRHRKIRSLEEELVSKWIKHKIEEERSRRIEARRSQLQEEVLAEQSRQPTLF